MPGRRSASRSRRPVSAVLMDSKISSGQAPTETSPSAPAASACAAKPGRRSRETTSTAVLVSCTMLASSVESPPSKHIASYRTRSGVVSSRLRSTNFTSSLVARIARRPSTTTACGLRTATRIGSAFTLLIVPAMVVVNITFLGWPSQPKRTGRSDSCRRCIGCTVTLRQGRWSSAHATISADLPRPGWHNTEGPAPRQESFVRTAVRLNDRPVGHGAGRGASPREGARCCERACAPTRG